MSEYEDFDLDEDVSDVEDIISFSNPPKGIHLYGIVFCGMDKLGSGDDSANGVRIIYQHIKTEQKANPEDMDVAPYSIFGEQFMGGETGKKWLKKRLTSMFGELSGSFGPYIRQLNEKKMSEYLVRLTTSIAKSKKDGNEYENVRIQDLKLIPIEPGMIPDGFKMYEHTPNLD